MRNKLPIANGRWPIERNDAVVFSGSIANRKSKIVNGFTLIEVLVVMVLMLLIVMALMAVFNSTQTAFRAGVTQAAVLEDGRAAMDLIAADLRTMAPSGGGGYGGINFFVEETNYVSPPSPLVQSLVGGSAARTNVLENFFILGRGNANGVPTWYGVGYAVTTNAPPGPLYSLYRYSTSHPVAAVDPGYLFNEFRTNFLAKVASAGNGSHLMDGVVGLTARAYNPGGCWIYTNIATISATSTNYLVWAVTNSSGRGEPCAALYFYSNTIPAAVEIEMGVLEDRALQRAQSIPNATVQSNYLANAVGKVHLFRQRVAIPNVDPSAYP